MTEEEYKILRNKYHPIKRDKTVEIIFVFESPPASGKYFYNSGGSKSENLYRDTMKAFLGKKFPSKDEGLKEFARNGLFLIDSTYIPVNKLGKKARRDNIRNNINKLIEDIEKNLLDSKDCKLIIVSRHVFDITKEKLEEKFQSKVINNDIFVPYNGFGQQQKFRNAIRKIFSENNINKKIYDKYIC